MIKHNFTLEYWPESDKIYLLDNGGDCLLSVDRDVINLIATEDYPKMFSAAMAAPMFKFLRETYK